MSPRKKTIKGVFYKAGSPPCRQEKDKLGVREESKYGNSKMTRTRMKGRGKGEKEGREWMT